MCIQHNVCVHARIHAFNDIVQSNLFSSAAENASELPVHVYDTVSDVTQGVQIQANPSYTPITQSLQTPTGAVPMQANPSYITITGLTEEYS